MTASFKPWQEVSLKDVCSKVQYGFTASASTDPIGPKFLRITDIVPQFLEWDSVPFCEIDEKKKSKYELREGDIVIARTGATTGYAKYIKSPPTAVFASYLVRLVLHDELDKRFVGYIVESDDYKRYIMRNIGGAAQPNANAQVLASYTFRLPPLPAQRRIASILSTYDDLIENNTRRIAILEEMARRLYEEWFVKFRFPGDEKTKLDDDLPKGWALGTLGDVCDRITDGAHKSPPSVDCGKPMASVKDMHEWGVHLDKCRHISETDYDELVRNNCKPQLNDILIAKDGANLNKHTFLMREEQEIVLLSSIAILRPGKDIHPEFLLSQLKSSEVSDRIKQSKSGAAIPRIVLKDFKRLQILVPLREIQEYWAETAGPMATMCRTLAKQNTNLRKQRDILLPKLVSGQIDVSEVEVPDTEEEAA